MTKQTLYDIRTNTYFTVNYDDLNLVAQIEVILLATHPAYEIVRKGNKSMIEKGHKLQETRFVTDLRGINELIGQLQATAASLQVFEQMQAGLNKVIEQAKPEKP